MTGISAEERAARRDVAELRVRLEGAKGHGTYTLVKIATALRLLSELDTLRAENDILRGIAAKIMPCHYCGATELAKCPYGFPGCNLADDLFVAEQTQCAALRAERDAALKDGFADAIAQAIDFCKQLSTMGLKQRGKRLYRSISSNGADASRSLQARLEGIGHDRHDCRAAKNDARRSENVQ